MTTENRVPVFAGLFAETAEGPRLLGSRCAACGAAYFPRTSACHNPDCAEGRLEEAAFGPRGKLWSYAVQHYAPPAPACYDEPFAPYAIGLVDLPEGVRVLARLTPVGGKALAAIRVGMDVELVLDALCHDADGNAVITWKFRPLEEAER